MTEEEARERWCPMARVGEQASGAAENRPSGNLNCIASECMAWRWKTEPVDGREAYDEAVTTGTRGHIQRHLAIKAVIGDGFCGLAGPQS